MPRRILIADDHSEARRAIRRLLAGHSGWVICGEAENGLEAVEKAETLKPDIVVLDLSMPKMNGLEAAKIIHAASPGLPLLLFSINGGDLQARNEIRAAGFGGAVSKANGWLLLEAIERLLDGKTFLNVSVLATPSLAETEAVAQTTPHPADEPQKAKKAAAGADDHTEPPIA
jgi:two-component system, NarL family, response regulator NreC